MVSLKLSDVQGKRLSKEMAIRIQKVHIGPSHQVWVTGMQAKKIAGVAAGHHGYCLLLLGAPALKKTVHQHGGSFFSKLGDTLKNTFTKPSPRNPGSIEYVAYSTLYAIEGRSCCY